MRICRSGSLWLWTHDWLRQMMTQWLLIAILRLISLSVLVAPGQPGRLRRSLAKGTAPRSDSPHFKRPQSTTVPIRYPLPRFTVNHRFSLSFDVCDQFHWYICCVNGEHRASSKWCSPNLFTACPYHTHRRAFLTNAIFYHKFHTPIVLGLST